VLDEPLIHTPRERRRQATLDRILVTATAMIVQGGYGALSMTRLAAELDYTPGALYRYFPSKDRLTIALVAQAIHDFRAAIEARSAPAGGPIARIVALALGYKEAALSAPNRFGLVAMLLADPRFVVEDTSEAGPALAALSGALEPLADAFTKAQTAGALTSGDAIRRTGQRGRRRPLARVGRRREGPGDDASDTWRDRMTIALAVLLGALTWSFLEYVIHRWLGHERRFLRRRWNLFAREHVRHHSVGDYFAPARKKAVLVLIVTPTIAALLSLVAGWTLSLAYALGLIGFYLYYEWLHLHLHTHAPSTAYGRWARKNHFFHHFHDPSKNHGVTSGLWDRVFGTHVTPQVVEVPEKLKLRWLCDAETGELLAEHRADYRIRPPGARSAARAAA
jgi:AcrR family transcriptional regulator